MENQPNTTSHQDFATDSDIQELTLVIALVSAILFLLVIAVLGLIYYLWTKSEDNRRQISVLHSEVNILREQAAALQGRTMSDGELSRGPSVFTQGKGSGSTVHSPPASPPPHPSPPPSSPPSPPPSAFHGEANAFAQMACRDLPRYSITFMNQKVDVFESSVTGLVALPEIYENAANYYDNDPVVRQSMVANVHAERMTSVALENIKVVPLYKKNYAIVDEEKPLGSSNAAGRPKSMFIAPEPPVPGHAGLPLKPMLPQSMSGIFVTEVIGPAGGTMSIYGVTLKIPPGALLEEQEIRLGIIWEANRQPTLDRKTALLSPVISCEPHELRFKKPVELVLPHCAHAEGTSSLESFWKFSIMQSETPLEASTNWLETSSQDVNLGEITPSKISFLVQHFTLYTIVAQAANAQQVAVKRVRLVAFAPPLDPPEFFRITVYCVNDYKDEMLEEEMKRAGAQVLDCMKPLLIHDSEKDVKIKLDKVPEGWQLSGAAHVDLDFELVWHAAGPNCSFVLKPIGEHIEIVCQVAGFQIGREQKRQIINIAQRKQVEMKRRSNTTTGNVFPPKLRRIIITLLDPPTPECNNWHMLAEKLSMRHEDIRHLENFVGRDHGPTYRLLQEWESRGSTLEQFQKVMVDIERHDVAAEVETFLKDNTTRNNNRNSNNTGNDNRVNDDNNSNNNNDDNNTVVAIEVTSVETQPKDVELDLDQ